MSALEPLPFWAPAAAATRDDDSADRLHALVAIAKVVASAEAFDDVLRLTAAEARAALGAASLSLSVWERERGWLRVVLNVGDLGPGERPDGTGEVYPVTEYSCIEALLDSQPYVQQVDADPATPGYDAAVVGLLRDLGKGSCMGVPVVLEGRVWGELFATRYPGDRPYGREDLDFAGAVAGQIAAGAAQVRHLEQVARLAYTDELTGLANRRAIEDRLDAAIARHRATGSSVSLIIADVNGLKRINDDRGHEAGDRALVHVSGLLSASAGLVPGSLAGRLSGDEFCIVLEDVAADHAVWVAEDLCRRAKAGLDEGVACGVASTGDPVGVIDSRKRLFRLADAAQSRASAAAPADRGRPAAACPRTRPCGSPISRGDRGTIDDPSGRGTPATPCGCSRTGCRPTRTTARCRFGGAPGAAVRRSAALLLAQTRPLGCPSLSRGPGQLVSVVFSAIRMTAGYLSTGRGPVPLAADQAQRPRPVPGDGVRPRRRSMATLLTTSAATGPSCLCRAPRVNRAVNLMAGARQQCRRWLAGQVVHRRDRARRRADSVLMLRALVVRRWPGDDRDVDRLVRPGPRRARWWPRAPGRGGEGRLPSPVCLRR